MSQKNLFVSNLGWQHSDFNKIIKLIKKNNITGIDIAPIQLNNRWNNIEKKLQKFQKKIKYLNLKVNALQGIFYKTDFNLFQSDKLQKKKISRHMKKILKISRMFDCKKIIIGSSYFRKVNNVSEEKADLIFINFFKNFKPLLKKKKIYLCFETIPKNYGENYLYDIKKLIYLIKKIKSPWCKVNFDSSLFHFRKFDKNIFLKNKKYIKNIQISEKNFNYLIKPSKSNMYFSKLINNDKKNKDISLEIIAKTTNLRKISLSLNNFRKIFN